MDPWTSNWLVFWSLQLQTRCHFGKCALHVFDFGFHRKPWGQTSSMSLPFYEKICGPFLVHTAAGRILAVGVSPKSSRTWGPCETTSILHCEILSFWLRVLKNRSHVGLELGRAQEELLPDTMYKWTELVDVWILAYLALFNWWRRFLWDFLLFVQRNFYQIWLLLKALVTWLRRPAEGWTLG